ncbi:MAG: hypothetical protein ACIALR_03560 [Blastopirellula sp. JB062]
MQDIDFLPKKFRDRRKRRRASVYRWIGAASVGGVLLLAALLQLGVQRRLQTQRNSLEPAYLTAVAKREKLIELQSQLAKDRKEAQLYATLRSHWPTTQLLTCIAEPLPASLTFREMKLNHETASTTQRRNEEEETAATKSADQRDYEHFQSERQKRSSKIDIDGVVTDVSQLYEFMVKLNDHPLVQRAIIESVEPIDQDEDLGRSDFELQVVLAPPLGVQAIPTATTAAKGR